MTMFLPLNIHSVDCKFVVDTGSAVTILSSTVFNKMSSLNISLQKPDPTIRLEVADRGHLTIEGIG